MRELHCPTLLTDFGPRNYLFNVGPPMKSESIRVKTSIFKESVSSIRWNWLTYVEINFEDRPPIEVVDEAMEICGVKSCDELLEEFNIYPAPLACRPISQDKRRPFELEHDPKSLLQKALILGLCGPSTYDPRRPVIWTNNRLSRALELYAPGRFYGNQ